LFALRRALLQNLLESLSVEEGTEDRLISKFSLAEILNFPADLEDLKSPLHISSELGCTEAVRLLLLSGADPTLLDARSRHALINYIYSRAFNLLKFFIPIIIAKFRPAYYLAKDKNTRDIFRKVRGFEGMEERWNWEAAGVPPAITGELN